MINEPSEAFKEAAAPLAEFLANVHVNDVMHQFVLADLYDMVNAIRDTKVAAISAKIATLKSTPEYLWDRSKRIDAIRCQRNINFLLGSEGI